MLTAGEIKLAQRTKVSGEELESALAREKGSRSTTLNAISGSIVGAGLGVVSGVGLASGVIPGSEVVASFGSTMPALLGVCLAGVGGITGSFVDLLSIVNIWRR